MGGDGENEIKRPGSKYSLYNQKKHQKINIKVKSWWRHVSVLFLFPLKPHKMFFLPGQRLLKLLDGSIEADEVGGQVDKVCIVLVD